MHLVINLEVNKINIKEYYKNLKAAKYAIIAFTILFIILGCFYIYFYYLKYLEPYYFFTFIIGCCICLISPIFEYNNNKMKIKKLRPILQFLFQNNFLIFFRLRFKYYWDEMYWDKKKLESFKEYYRKKYLKVSDSKLEPKKELKLQQKYFEIAFNDAIQISKKIYLRLEELNKKDENLFYKKYLKFIGGKYKKDENLRKEYIDFRDKIGSDIIKLLNLI